MENEYIILTDENGEQQEYEVLDLIEYENKEYVVLLPYNDFEQEDDDEVLILEIEEGDDEIDEYLSVDDEVLLNILFEIFKERNKDIFDFHD